MHIVVLFHHIGGYHAARLRAAHAVCLQQGWQLTAIQETDSAQEHPWGDLSQAITFPLRTLLTAKEAPAERDRHPQSAIAASRLPACLEQLKPDMLVIPGWGYPNSRAALKWAKKRHISAILMSESKWNDEPRTWWKEALKSRLYVRAFKSALVGGQLHHDYLVKLGFSPSAIALGYDIVDNAHFTNQAQQARTNASLIRQQQPKIPTAPYFIAVTRFIPRKNVLRLIDAYAQYRNLYAQSVHQAIHQAVCQRTNHQKQAWDLVICGSGIEEDIIRAKISQYNLTAFVHLPGFKSYQEIPQWFGLASAFIHPAFSEQWGLVVNEALASGLPVLVSNQCGCFPEMVREGINGFGFDPHNTAELAQLMIQISQGKVNLQAMSKAALEHVQHFSPDTFGKGFKQAVEYALSS